MGNKQTAVEWIVEQLAKKHNEFQVLTFYYDHKNEIEQAKQMEEQQIKNAVIFGINHGSDECRVFGLDARPYGAKQGAHYINQTYKTNGK